MDITINISNSQGVDWAAKGTDRIVQNIVNLLNTFRYEVAYDRTLGLSGKFIDKPTDKSIAETIAEIYDLIQTREPRAKLKEVQYIGLDEQGNMQFKVVIDVG